MCKHQDASDVSQSILLVIQHNVRFPQLHGRNVENVHHLVLFRFPSQAEIVPFLEAEQSKNETILDIIIIIIIIIIIVVVVANPEEEDYGDEDIILTQSPYRKNKVQAHVDLKFV